MSDTNNSGVSGNTKLIAGSIIIAAIIIGGAVLYKPGQGVANRPSETANASDVINPVAPSIDDDFVLGDSEAPVTMIVFGDYQCPYCKKMFDETETKIRTKYVDTGMVQMVYRDYPLDSIHPFARKAAEASQCAGDQGSYWQYHDALFAKQAEIPALNFTELAVSMKLDGTIFDECLSSGKFTAEVEKDSQDGQALGIEGTPASYINGTLIPGAYPYETFEQVIEAALKSADQ